MTRLNRLLVEDSDPIRSCQCLGSYVTSQDQYLEVFAYAGLEPDTEYLVKVRSSNSAGPGEWSQPVLFRTGPAAPSIPHSVYATGECSSKQILLFYDLQI